MKVRAPNIRLILLLGLIQISCLSSVLLAQDKLTPRLHRLLAASSPGETQTVWLYIDSSGIDTMPIPLSDRAVSRRGRVDGANLLVDWHDYPVSDSTVRVIRQSVAAIRGQSRWLKAVAAEATAEQIRQVSRLPVVRRIDRVMTLMSMPKPMATGIKSRPQLKLDDRFNYGVSRFQNQFVNAIRLHNAGLTGDGVRIALFDTGFEPDHEAFDSALVVGTWDFINNDTLVDDSKCSTITRDIQTYHGTLVWGVIGGNLPGELIGIALDAEYMLAKTEISCFGTEIKLEEDNWIRAAEWADTYGADIISSSLGYYRFQDSGSYDFSDLDGDTPLITAAADIAASKNILVLNAAGNERLSSTFRHIIAPADGDSVIAVGAVNPDSSIASFSSPGPTADGRIKPDIVSLGVGVIAAYPLGGLAVVDGTSFSTPLVAGAAALALQHDPSLTAEELRNLIRASGNRSVLPDNDFGYGIFDAVKTADIVRVVAPEVITVLFNEAKSVTITTAGRSETTPRLTAPSLPIGVELIDHQDGTATLHILGSHNNALVEQFQIVADVGYFTDTALVTLETTESSDGARITVGPNPFSDTINVYVPPSVGIWSILTVYTISGEKVWETVNVSRVTSDIIITWDGRSASGDVVADGAYVIRVSTDRVTEMIKVLKVR